MKTSTAHLEPAKDEANEAVASHDLFSRLRAKNRHMQEMLIWKHPSEEKPDEETTVLIQTTDGEVTGGYITHDENDRQVWRLEYWPSTLRDKVDRQVLAWPEWPGGPFSGAGEDLLENKEV